MARRFSRNDPRLDVPLTSGGHRLAEIVSADRSILADRGAESEARQAAANRLFCLRKTARPAYNELLQCVKGTESGVRSMCCWGLAAVAESPGQAIPQLLDVVKSRSGPRATAACAIGSFGPGGAAAVPELTTALKDRYGDVRASAAMSLGKIEATSAVDDIVGALLEFAPSGDPVEYNRLIIQGLVEFADDVRVRWALERFRNACNWRNEYADDHGRSDFDLEQPGELERYVRFFSEEDEDLRSKNGQLHHRRDVAAVDRGVGGCRWLQVEFWAGAGLRRCRHHSHEICRDEKPGTDRLV